MKKIILEIQRWSMTDGPGTRTVVFLKGCPLHCPWCANPESQSRHPQVGIFPSRCVQCQACARECPQDIAISAKQGAFAESRLSPCRCTQCGACIEACHARARSWMGAEMSADEVFELIKKDMVFYRKSGGGVTFSGGEPLMHPGFVLEIISKCQRVGIHTAIETCGVFAWPSVKDVVSQADFLLFDLKHMDDHKHIALTGASNQGILENAVKIARLGIPMVIRIPVIPSLNDDQDNIVATAGFVRAKLPGVHGIELLPYHKLGLAKYQALGREYKLDHLEPPSDAHMQALGRLVTAQGVHCITAEDGYEPKPASKALKIVA